MNIQDLICHDFERPTNHQNTLLSRWAIIVDPFTDNGNLDPRKFQKNYIMYSFKYTILKILLYVIPICHPWSGQVVSNNSTVSEAFEDSVSSPAITKKHLSNNFHFWTKREDFIKEKSQAKNPSVYKNCFCTNGSR